MNAWPPCGLYRTSTQVAGVPAGTLVYFHNHGEPGPGVYLPSGWQNNKAVFHAQGTPLPDIDAASQLEPLLPEGLYRVSERFVCCEKKCRTFEPDDLVQLGYDGAAQPILFLPGWQGGLSFPARGTPVDRPLLKKLAALRVDGLEPGRAQGRH